MAQGGKLLASIFKQVGKEVQIGVSTKHLDEYAEKLILECGGQPSFKGQGGYPATICISINDEVVHGVPSVDCFIKNGDLVSLDIGMFYQGFHSDMAATFCVGDVDPKMRRLARVAKKALKYGIKKAKPGNTFGDIGNTIQRYVESQGFSVVRDLCGHGIGRQLHEEPQIFNYGQRHKGAKISVGMTFCIEPMITAGSPEIFLAKNKQTYKTKDASWAAHFEHTLAITSATPQILTEL